LPPPKRFKAIAQDFAVLARLEYDSSDIKMLREVVD
jgi:hypothetical protein